MKLHLKLLLIGVISLPVFAGEDETLTDLVLGHWSVEDNDPTTTSDYYFSEDTVFATELIESANPNLNDYYNEWEMIWSIESITPETRTLLVYFQMPSGMGHYKELRILDDGNTIESVTLSELLNGEIRRGPAITWIRVD
jgi:hypothetical protein